MAVTVTGEITQPTKHKERRDDFWPFLQDDDSRLSVI
jgi:hypothetical protein